MGGSENISLPPALLILVIIVVVLLALVTVPLPIRRRRGGLDAFPFVSVLILTLNVLVFFATDMAHNEKMVRAGALGLQPFRWWALLTYQFLHGGLGHICGNMVTFWVLGIHLEEVLGWRRYLLYYLGSGIAGGLAQLAASGGEPLIGASGAIFGLMGLFAVRFWRTKMRFFFFKMPAVVAMTILAGLQVWSIVAELRAEPGEESAHVGFFAHLGGFVFGAGLAGLTRIKEEGKREYGIEDAEKALQERRLDEALSQYRRLLLDSPDDPGLHHTLAILCPQVGQPEAARRHFEQALKLYGRSGPPEALVRAFYDARQALPDLLLPPAQLLRIASACEQTDHLQLARVCLSEIIERYPASPEAETGQLRLGRLLLEKLDRPDQAVLVLEEFLRRYPASPNLEHARRYLSEARRAIM